MKPQEHDLQQFGRPLSRDGICVRNGFSLTELMVASALSLIVLLAVLTTFTVMTSNFKRAANYGQIHREGRWAVDNLAKDFRMASDITNVGSSTVTVVIPTGFDAQGNLSGTKNIKYSLLGTSFVRQDLTANQSKTLAFNVSSVSFMMYNRLGQYTTLTAACKGCQVDIKLLKTVVGTRQTEDFLSARLMLRNKP
jgi:prepilin-type N-terminal cleavage/methylation domain-containing protein